MRTIGVRELKAHLSATLRHVQRGEHYIITDRGRVVAELKQLGAPTAGLATQLDRQEQALLKMVAEGRATLPTGPRVPFRAPGLEPMPDGTAAKLLDWVRGDR